MAKFRQGQDVVVRGKRGVVEAFGLTPEMVDVRYGHLVKRHHYTDVQAVAKNNTGRRRKSPSRGRRNPEAEDAYKAHQARVDALREQQELLEAREAEAAEARLVAGKSIDSAVAYATWSKDYDLYQKGYWQDSPELAEARESIREDGLRSERDVRARLTQHGVLEEYQEWDRFRQVPDAAPDMAAWARQVGGGSPAQIMKRLKGQFTRAKKTHGAATRAVKPVAAELAELEGQTLGLQAAERAETRAGQVAKKAAKAQAELDAWNEQRAAKGLPPVDVLPEAEYVPMTPAQQALEKAREKTDREEKQKAESRKLKKAPGAPIKRKAQVSDRATKYSAAGTAVLASREGARWMALPDPPRFEGGMTQLCGNPIDGTMYVIAVKTEGRYLNHVITNEEWDSAYAAWSVNHPGVSGATAPREVLKRFMSTPGKNTPKGKWERLEVRGNSWKAVKGPLEPSEQIPFTAAEVFDIQEGEVHAGEMDFAADEERTESEIEALTIALQAVQNDVTLAGSAKQYIQLILSRTAEEDQESDRSLLEREVGEARLFDKEVGEKRIRRARFYWSWMTHENLWRKFRGDDGLKYMRSLITGLLTRGTKAHSERRIESLIDTAERRLARARQGKTSQRRQRGERGLAMQGRKKGAKGRIKSKGIPPANTHFEAVPMPGSKRQAFKVSDKGELLPVQGGAAIGYVYYVVSKKVSPAKSRLESFDPPYSSGAAKRWSPFFSWQPLKRPLDHRITQGTMGKGRKGAFRSPPLCTSKQSLEYTKIAKEMEKPLYAMSGALGWMVNTLEKFRRSELGSGVESRLITDTKEVNALENAAKNALSVTAWFASWSQDLALTLELVKPEFREGLDYLSVFDTFGRYEKGGKVYNSSGLSPRVIVATAEGQPIPLVVAKKKVFRGQVQRAKLLDGAQAGKASLLRDAAGTAQQMPLRFGPREFLSKDRESGVSFDVSWGVNKAVAAGRDQEDPPSEAEVLAGLVVEKLIASGRLNPADRDDKAHELAKKAEAYFTDDEADSDSAPKYARALFFIYEGLGGAALQAQIKSALGILELLRSNGGQLPEIDLYDRLNLIEQASGSIEQAAEKKRGEIKFWKREKRRNEVEFAERQAETERAYQEGLEEYTRAHKKELREFLQTHPGANKSASRYHSQYRALRRVEPPASLPGIALLVRQLQSYPKDLRAYEQSLQTFLERYPESRDPESSRHEQLRSRLMAKPSEPLLGISGSKYANLFGHSGLGYYFALTQLHNAWKDYTKKRRKIDAKIAELMESSGKSRETWEKTKEETKAKVAEARMGSSLHRLGQGVQLFYTFNPALFYITKSQWNSGQPPWPEVGEKARKDHAVREQMEDLDAVGRYGFALKLFYEEAIGQKTLLETAEALAKRFKIQEFFSEFQKLLSAGLDPNTPRGQALMGESLDRAAALLETRYPDMAKVSPGQGGVHGGPGGIVDWATSLIQEDKFPEKSVAAFQLAAYTSDYLQKSRSEARAGLTRRRSRNIREVKAAAAGRERYRERKIKDKVERAAFFREHGKYPPTPPLQIGDDPGVETLRITEHLPSLDVGSAPELTAAEMRRLEKSDRLPSRYEYPPQASVAALESSTQDAPNLRNLIERRKRQLAGERKALVQTGKKKR